MDGKRVGGAGAKAHGVCSIVMTAPSTLPTPLESFIVENKTTNPIIPTASPAATGAFIIKTLHRGLLHMYRAFALTQNQHKL
jgi:hypothetical protein